MKNTPIQMLTHIGKTTSLFNTWKVIITGILFIISTHTASVYAQPENRSKISDPMAPPMASTSVGTGRIILVPFQSNELLSDATTDIAKHNGMNGSEVRETLRFSMDANLYRAIEKRRPTVRLMVDSLSEGMNDLEAFYNSLSYKYVVPPSIEETHKAGVASKLGISDIKPKDTKPVTMPLGNGRMKLPDEQTRYYSATITNKNLLPYMAEKYDADYFLFINQMEIKTRYEYCLDLANQNYEREVSVHYSLFDKSGKLVVGDVMTLYYPSAENNLERVIKDNFGIIAGYIAGQVPMQ